MSESTKNTIQWQPMIELIVVLLTILGSTIPLYIHTDNKMQALQVENNRIIEAIRLDMRDFHVRLEKQDSEFKSRLCAIEERNKGK